MTGEKEEMGTKDKWYALSAVKIITPTSAMKRRHKIQMMSNASTVKKTDTLPKTASNLADATIATASIISPVIVPQLKPADNEKFVSTATKWAISLESVPNPPSVSCATKSVTKSKTATKINTTIPIDKSNSCNNQKHASTAKDRATTPQIVQNHQNVISVDNKDTFQGIVLILLWDQGLLTEGKGKRKLRENIVLRNPHRSQRQEKTSHSWNSISREDQIRRRFLTCQNQKEFQGEKVMRSE